METVGIGECDERLGTFCLVLCFNWQDPIQSSTTMPQWPNRISFMGILFFSGEGGVRVFLYRAVHQWMQSLLRETGEPRLESAQGPSLSHH